MTWKLLLTHWEEVSLLVDVDYFGIEMNMVPVVPDQLRMKSMVLDVPDELRVGLPLMLINEDSDYC